jgi:hypothetical protein
MYLIYKSKFTSTDEWYKFLDSIPDVDTKGVNKQGVNKQGVDTLEDDEYLDFIDSLGENYDDDTKKLVPPPPYSPPEPQKHVLIDLYEYFITGYYSQDFTIKRQFGSLTYANTCGSIGIRDSEKKPDSSFEKILVSCDELDSYNKVNDEDPVFKLLQSTKYLKDHYKIYKNLLTRSLIDELLQNEFYSVSTIDKINQIDSIYGLMISMYTDFGKEYKAGSFIDKIVSNSYVLHLIVNETEKVVAIGDIHGSFHTFFRILLRLHLQKIINLTELKVNDGFRIIFLGDILDRGNFGLDIIYIIFKMILINNKDLENPKIIFNRGNHEEIEQNQNHEYGFGNVEVQKKWELYCQTTLKETVDQDKCKKEWEKFFIKIVGIYSLFSSAVILNFNGKKRVWLCHGGIPISSTLDHTDFNVPDYKNITFIKDPSISLQIRWNDFIGKDKTVESVRGDSFYNIGVDDILNFFKKNKISFIVRGHQDSYANSYLLSDNRKYSPTPDKTQSFIVNGLQLNDKNLENNDDEEVILIDRDDIDYDTEMKRYKRSTIGAPIRRIVASSINKTSRLKLKSLDGISFKVYPVLTISTNTDLRRNLFSDNYVILSYDTFVL